MPWMWAGTRSWLRDRQCSPEKTMTAARLLAACNEHDQREEHFTGKKERLDISGRLRCLCRRQQSVSLGGIDEALRSKRCQEFLYRCMF